LRLSPLRRGLYAAALSATMTFAGAVPALAQDDNQGTTASTPTAGISKVGVGKRKLDVRAGRMVVVTGTVLPRAARRHTAYLQIRTGRRWHTIDRDRTGAQSRYVLRDKRRHPMSARVRILVRGDGVRAKRRIGRLNVYRQALASWYGPGFYGQRTGCGGRLGYSQLGVAHKTLPCGTKVTLRHHGRVVRVPVIDRGPYVGGREYDLTAATARKLGFGGHGPIDVTR